MKHLIIILLVIVGFSSCDISEKKAKQNYENLKKVKIGMTMDTVVKIMGDPDTIIIDPYKSQDRYYRYLYQSEFGMSDNFYVFFSKEDSLVFSINYGD